MPASFPLNPEPRKVPETLVRDFRIEIQDDQGNWQLAKRVENNYQRLVKVPVAIKTRAIRFIPEKTWGAEKAHVFAWDVR